MLKRFFKLRILFVFLSMAFVFPALANNEKNPAPKAESEKIEKKEPEKKEPEKKEVVKKEIEKKESEKKEVVTEKPPAESSVINPDVKNNDLRIASVFSALNHNLDAKTGFKMSDTSDWNSGLKFTLKHKFKTAGELRLTSSSVMNDDTISSSLSPQKIKTETKRGGIDYKFDSGFGLGGQYRERISDKTNPNQAIPNETRAGVRGFYAGDHTFDKYLSFEYEIGLNLPVYNYESTPRTGAFSYSVMPDLRLQFIYKLNHFLSASVGVECFYEQTQYQGDGDRGTISAKETFIQTQIPIELIFQF